MKRGIAAAQREKLEREVAGLEEAALARKKEIGELVGSSPFYTI
jgi:hypothetical protein